MGSRFLLLLFSLMLALGCSMTTRPNISAIYRVPALESQLDSPAPKSKLSNLAPLSVEVQLLFKRLYIEHPALAEEIGRLPEFRTEVGNRQILAFNRFIKMINGSTPAEKNRLNEFLKVGLPGNRRYCTPLQALFWILEKHEYEPERSPLKFSLRQLLDEAWDFSENNRWKGFNIVTDRLNAPELIDYYERRQITYSRGHRYDMSPYEVFSLKTGHCISITAFTVHCLRKGGYRARDLRVKSPTGHPAGHHVTLFELNDSKYIMDNGRPYGRGIIPFDRYCP
jgi:hypothetical protein